MEDNTKIKKIKQADELKPEENQPQCCCFEGFCKHK
jgi:hypothetical protein